MLLNLKHFKLVLSILLYHSLSYQQSYSILTLSVILFFIYQNLFYKLINFHHVWYVVYEEYTFSIFIIYRAASMNNQSYLIIYYQDINLSKKQIRKHFSALYWVKWIVREI